MTREPVAAAILAGGQARRFGGVHKPLLVIGAAADRRGPSADAFPASTPGDIRIIDQQLAVLRPVADPIFIVAADSAPYQHLGVDVRPDVLPGRGALGGIYTAIVTSPRQRTLVVAGDLPFLPPALIDRLAAGDTDLVIPRGTRGLEPLCAMYSKACAAPIRARLEAGSLRAAELPEDVRVEIIEPDALASYDPDGLLFVNVNTPHDYERARGLFESMLQPRGDRITDKRSTS
jgi:molybdopterin-guanine dinucleotide biosynthesis protein A